MNKLIHGPNAAGQSIVDRMMAAKHTIAGQDLGKAVFKATTEELMGPKRKHLDYLIYCSNSPNVSIPEMANQLIGRTTNSSWVVVFKALITIHDLMNYGNERFMQYLASTNCSFSLDNFLDKTSSVGYEMSVFVRRYGRYVMEKSVSYRHMGYDFCKVRRGKEDGLLRKMDTDKLLKALPVLQNQLDVLMNFNVTPNELMNGVINVCFLALFKDLIRLFACYNDGIINLLEKYFEMDRRHCVDALDIYKKFIVRMDSVQAFLRVAEMMGIDRQEIPDLAQAPASLVDALEEHLKSLESSKRSGVSAPLPKPVPGVTKAISNFTAAAQVGVAPGAGTGALTITDAERQRILEEEQRQLDQLKKEKLKQQQLSSSTTKATTQPVASPRTMVATAVASPRTSAVPPPVAAPRTTASNVRQSSLETAPSEAFETKVLRSQELESAFAENSVAKPLSAPPPGFNSFGEILKPTVLNSAPPTKNIDLASLTLNETSMRVNPSGSAATGVMPTSSVPMSPAIVIPISPLSAPYGMTMMPPAYTMAGNQYWMQPRMMMLGQPGTVGWNQHQRLPASFGPRPQFQEQVQLKPNDPFGVL